MVDISFVPGCSLGPASVPEEAGSFSGIAEVLAWVARCPKDCEMVGSVTQDEYSHDFVIKLLPAGHLAYGVT